MLNIRELSLKKKEIQPTKSTDLTNSLVCFKPFLVLGNLIKLKIYFIQIYRLCLFNKLRSTVMRKKVKSKVFKL